MDVFTLVEHLVFIFIVTSAVNIWCMAGTQGLILAVIKILKAGVPGLQFLLNKVLHREAQNFTKMMNIKDDGSRSHKATIPKSRVPIADLLAELPNFESTEKYREEGKIFGYLYGSDEDDFVKAQKQAFQLFTEKTGLSEEHDKLLLSFNNTFSHQSALNPTLFPTVRRFENEIIDMTAALLHGDVDTVGSLTSGGTESILMAIKTYRDRARKLSPHIKHPEMVAPVTIHPLHDKAAQYFGIKLVKVPVSEDCKPDLKEFEAAITKNTIGLLCSAPETCYGVVDPIEGISSIALRRKLPLHVDATYGAFILPWLQKLGYEVPKFDFQVPGVSSISTDIHKCGFGIKDCSVLLHKNPDMRRFQIFSCSTWPGGFLASLSMAGTRGGAAISAHWVTLQSIGEDGYCDLTKKLIDITQRFKDAVDKIKDLQIIGRPSMTIVAIKSRNRHLDIFKVADLLQAKGWHVERHTNHKSIMFSFQLCHEDNIDSLVKDIEECVDSAKQSSPSVHSHLTGTYMSLNQRALDSIVPRYYGTVYTQRAV